MFPDKRSQNPDPSWSFCIPDIPWISHRTHSKSLHPSAWPSFRFNGAGFEILRHEPPRASPAQSRRGFTLKIQLPSATQLPSICTGTPVVIVSFQAKPALGAQLGIQLRSGFGDNCSEKIHIRTSTNSQAMRRYETESVQSFSSKATWNLKKCFVFDSRNMSHHVPPALSRFQLAAKGPARSQD
jgi:hypothetical protein